MEKKKTGKSAEKIKLINLNTKNIQYIINFISQMKTQYDQSKWGEHNIVGNTEQKGCVVSIAAAMEVPGFGHTFEPGALMEWGAQFLGSTAKQTRFFARSIWMKSEFKEAFGFNSSLVKDKQPTADETIKILTQIIMETKKIKNLYPFQ